mmetsp:Transcript_32373/g.70669  ORF Transcript_32373/g.70669 Transcript_32373/m.70669 type:complete len:300 (-) Transcript_32373:476-1375(-)
MEDGELILEKMPNKRDASRFGYKRQCDGCYMMAVTPDEVYEYAGGEVFADQNSYPNLTWIGNYKKAQNKWAERMYGEYFGNEASHAEFYTKAAFVAKVAPFSERSSSLPKAESLTPAHVHLTKPAAQKADRAQPKLTQMFASEEGGAAPKRQRTEAAADSAGTSGAACEEASATAPPALFAAPKATSAAAKRQEALARVRTIHVIGGRGSKSDRKNGQCNITLMPGQGLKELKGMIRSEFGKVRSTKLGALELVGPEGKAAGTAKATDLVDGVTVRCTYAVAEGNPSIMRYGGFFGRMW